MASAQGITVYYEHPEWHTPLFRELERRGIPYVEAGPKTDFFKLDGQLGESSLFFNRMSPSAYLRGDAAQIPFTLSLLQQLEAAGADVINGSQAFGLEISKASQVSLLQRLGLPTPRTVLLHNPDLAVDAAKDLRFPILTKPNIGGSGAGIQRFDSEEEISSALADGSLSAGFDGTLLLQEYVEPKDGRITRVEFLNDEFLYAIQIEVGDAGFNLCPADICETERSGAQKVGGISYVRPPEHVIDAVLRIGRAGGMALGGVEYLESAQDGQIYYYDVNALSNFVAKAPDVVGFDPWIPLVDYLEVRRRAA